MTAILRGRVPQSLKTQVSNLAKKRMTNEGQIVREAICAWLEKQPA